MRKEIEAVCFPVEKVRSSSIMKDEATEFNSENSYAIVGHPVRTDKEGNQHSVTKVLNFCSDLYNLLDNKRILEPLEKIMEEKVKEFQAAHKDENIELYVVASSPKDSQFFVRMSPEVNKFSRAGEIIKPMVMFTNSYDGHLKATAIGGLVRYLVDNKGNVTRTYTGYLKGYSLQYIFKHSNELIYTMDEVALLVEKYFMNFNQIETLIRKMKQCDLRARTTTQLEGVAKKILEGAGVIFPSTYITGLDKKGQRLIGTTVMSVVERIRYEMKIFDVETLDLWTLYNALNYVLMNAETEMPEKIRIDSDNKLLAYCISKIPVEASIDAAQEKQEGTVVMVGH